MSSIVFQTIFGCCLGWRRKDRVGETAPLLGHSSSANSTPAVVPSVVLTEDEREQILNQKVSTIAQNAAGQMLNPTINRAYIAHHPLSNQSSSHINSQIASTSRQPPQTLPQQQNPGTEHSSRQSSYRQKVPTPVEPENRPNPSTELYHEVEPPPSETGTDAASATLDTYARPSRLAIGASRRLIVHRGRPPPKRPTASADEPGNGIAESSEDATSNRHSGPIAAPLPSSPPIPVASGSPRPREQQEQSSATLVDEKHQVHYQPPAETPLILHYD